MDFQRSMWAEAWVQGVAARKFVAFGIVGELVIEQSMVWLEDSISPGIVFVWMLASVFVWCFLAYAVHAQILSSSDHLSPRYMPRVFGFALRTIAIFIIVWGVVIGVLLFPALIPALKKLLAYGFETQLPYEIPLIAAWLLLVLVVVGLPLFVWLGTSLPAYVAGRAGGMVAAFQRGKAQFGWITGRLMIGPIFLTALLTTLSFLPAVQTNDTVSFWDGEGVFQPVAVLWSVSYYAVWAFGVSLTAVILSRAFLRAEVMPDTAAA